MPPFAKQIYYEATRSVDLEWLSMARRMSEQVALSEKVKVECDFREYRERPHTLGNNVYACGIGAMKNVVMGAS